MLTILNDPAGITGKHAHEWDYTRTLQDNIAAHLASGADCELAINGVKVDPLTDARMLMPPSVLDVVVVARRPAGFDPISWWVIAAIVVGAVAVTYALMPKIDAGGGNVGKDSPNNRLTAQSNTARAYQGIPDIYGIRRVWPDMIQPSTVEYIDNIKYVTEWLCISRGKGDISAVQYADTPILDIAGASFEVFQPVGSSVYPENNSTTLADVFETFASDEVNGQELEYPTPFPALALTGSFVAVMGAASFTVTVPDGAGLANLKSLVPAGTAGVAFNYGIEPAVFGETCTVTSFIVSGGNATLTFSSTPWVADQTEVGIAIAITPNGITPNQQGPYTLPVICDRLRWNTVFLRGLKGSVAIRAEWWRVNDDGVEVGGTRQSQDNSYSADTYDQRFYTNNVTPSGGSGRYRMQFTRTSAQIGDGGTDVAKLEEVYAVRHYATKVLPGVTIIRVTTKATEQATGYSERKFNLKFDRHIRTLTTDTLSASRNFARVMAHIWTLAGNPISELDTDALAAVNAEFGEDSILLRFDASLDDADMSLGERLQLVANHARCIVWRDGQKWTVTRDQARQYPELQFDYRNLASDGDSALSHASHLPASNDGVEVEYVDPLTQAKKTYVRLSIASGAPLVGESANPKKIKLMGCTTLAQATNRAQLEARRLLYQRTSVSDKALSDANSLGLGSLVRWIDPNDFYGDDGLQGGEVMSISGATITTSETLNWNGATSGRMAFTDAQGGRLGAPVVCTPALGGVVLASVPAGLFLADAARQCGSRYAFAVGLTAAEVESAGLYTVTELKPAGNGTASLALAAYDARTYGYD
ncbi:MAG: host specificity factor TipJ family phage tail protein [Rhodoferax sp.]|nr:host specificity factor TipJ family phage tail protein [Rhodoferax sp.]